MTTPERDRAENALLDWMTDHAKDREDARIGINLVCDYSEACMREDRMSRPVAFHHLLPSLGFLRP